MHLYDRFRNFYAIPSPVICEKPIFPCPPPLQIWNLNFFFHKNFTHNLYEFVRPFPEFLRHLFTRKTKFSMCGVRKTFLQPRPRGKIIFSKNVLRQYLICDCTCFFTTPFLEFVRHLLSCNTWKTLFPVFRPPPQISNLNFFFHKSFSHNFYEFVWLFLEFLRQPLFYNMRKYLLPMSSVPLNFKLFLPQTFYT
jgi:hypothetical protein